MRGLRGIVVLLLLSGVLCAARSATAALPVVDLDCGDPVGESLKLADDLLDCPADGLRVDAPNITIDLNGKVVDGTSGAGDYGIDNTAGFSGVTVRNGTVRQFETGVNVGPGGTSNRIETVLIIQNTGTGVVFTDGPNRITGNTIAGNGDIGVDMSDSGNLVSGNLITSNGGDGIDLNSSDNNRVTSNTVAANDGIGIFVDGDRSQLVSNRVTGQATDGIDIQGNGNVLKRNVTMGNGEPEFSFENGIEVDGDENTLTKNTAIGNTGDGIFIATGVGNVVSKNTLNANGYGTGGGLGLDVPAGTAGSGNIARGNNNIDECDPTSLCVQDVGSGGQTMSCNDEVTTSIVLGNDILDCITSGLRVKADNITIDLNGHRLARYAGTGNPDEFGISNLDGHDGVKIINGEIQAFYNGVLADTSDKVTVQNVIIAGSVDSGVNLVGANHVVRKTTIADAGNHGIFVDGSEGALVTGTTVTESAFEGIRLVSLGGNTVERNRLWANDGAAVQMAASEGDLVQRNSTIGSGNGVFVVTGEGSRIVRNEVVGHTGVGIFVGAGGSTTPNTIGGNTANANGYSLGVSNGAGLGIDASGATGTTGRNIARGNDDVDECDPSTLC